MVYLFLAEGFETVEALAPLDILRRGKVELKTVGITGKTVVSSHGVEVTADLTADDIALDENIEAVILPGGMPGTLNLGNSDKVINAVRYCYEHDILIGAICAAPSILGEMGLLEGKKATAFPGFELKLKGAVYNNGYIETDGNIITARGMGVATEFGIELLAALKGRETADQVKASIQCRN